MNLIDKSIHGFKLEWPDATNTVMKLIFDYLYIDESPYFIKFIKTLFRIPQKEFRPFEEF